MSMNPTPLHETFDKTNPNFDLSFELLATLPPESGAHAKLSTLAQDFGFKDQKPLMNLINRLRDQGYSITTGHGTGRNKGQGRVAYIRMSGWPQARDDAQTYMHVMGQPSQTLKQAA